MNRTLMLLTTAGLLALAAAVVGLPRQKDTSHTVARPGELPGAGVVLPPVSARDGVLSLEGKLSGAWLMAGPSEAFAALTVRADTLQKQQRVPVNLALVIDRSGSMRGQKLLDATRAARLLLERLGPEDRLALVHYGTDVSVLPSQLVTAEARARMADFIDAIQDEGATNISGGLEAAASELRVRPASSSWYDVSCPPSTLGSAVAGASSRRPNSSTSPVPCTAGTRRVR